MGTLRQIKKNVEKNSLKFPQDMYISLAGSIVLTAYMFAAEKPDVKEIRKLWKTNKKKGFDFGLEDEEFIKKVCDKFNLPMFPLECAAYVQSDFQGLVAPYIDGNLLPLREDGLFTLTLRKGKIYPLTKKAVNNV